MFSFSAGVVESSNGQGSNAVGFVGNLNYFHRIKGWETSGIFQLRPKRAVGLNHLHDVLLQLHGAAASPLRAWRGVDRDLQRKPQRP